MIIHREQEFFVDYDAILEAFDEEWDNKAQDGTSEEDFVEYLIYYYGLDEILGRLDVIPDFESIKFI